MKYPTLLFIAVSCCMAACHPNNSNNVTAANAVWGNLDFVQINYVGHPNNSYLRASAVFYSSANNYASTVPVSGVTLNGIPLTTDINSYYYRANPVGNADTPTSWSVNGGSFAPSFSCNVSRPFLEYTGPLLPDTLPNRNGFTMTFPAGSLTDADTVNVAVYRLPRTAFIISHIKGMDQNQNVVLDAQDMGQSDTGRNIGNIPVSNTTYQTFGGKQYAFSKQRT